VGKRVNWVLDADFSDYFSSLDHQWLVKFLEHRIADRCHVPVGVSGR
jgi:RNA-directed DNA polymerase